MRQRAYISRREAEAKRRNRQGIALIAATVLGFAGMFYGAVQIDAANGITPAESMCNNGFSGFCGYAEPEPESGFYSSRDFCDPRDCGDYLKARKLASYEAAEVRLIGRCGGRYYAAKEESAFPADCDWIEPIRESL